MSQIVLAFPFAQVNSSGRVVHDRVWRSKENIKDCSVKQIKANFD